MRETDRAIVDKTLSVFQPRTSRTLTDEDCREIFRNVVGAFTVLLEPEAVDATHEPRFDPSPSQTGESES